MSYVLYVYSYEVYLSEIDCPEDQPHILRCDYAYGVTEYHDYDIHVECCKNNQMLCMQGIKWTYSVQIREVFKDVMFLECIKTSKF